MKYKKPITQKIYIVSNGEKMKSYSIVKFVNKVNANLFSTKCFTTKEEAKKHIKEMRK